MKATVEMKSYYKISSIDCWKIINFGKPYLIQLAAPCTQGFSDAHIVRKKLMGLLRMVLLYYF